MTPTQALVQIWAETGLPPDLLPHARLTGHDPCLPSSFAVGAAATASIAASALAAAALWRLRTGRPQTVSVDMRHACAEFQSEHHLRLHGRPAYQERDAIAGLYPTQDGWVRLHTNFPHHRSGTLRLLGCDGTREAVAAALRNRSAIAFENAAAAAGLAVTALRSFAEWDAHPQGQAVPTLPLIAIDRIADAPPEPLPQGPRPLSAIRVAELTRVIAGPVAGRTLAAHGADVLNITGPHLPFYRIEDLGRGKRAAQLDLRTPAGREALRTLIREARVFIQGYRPGAIAGHGFSPHETTALRPGLIHASLSAYGAEGPWSARRGFDSLVQTASGFNAAEAEAAGDTKPRPLPAQALDHATGYLLATGIMAALHRQATEGGSWHVQVSLARTGHWLRHLGRIENGFNVTFPGIEDLLEDSESGFGPMRAIAHAAQMSETPPRLDRPSMPLGTHAPSFRMCDIGPSCSPRAHTGRSTSGTEG